MLTLLVLRHGKSSWKDPTDDRLRPLKKRGRRASRLIGHALIARDLVPERILASPATRAQQTAARIADTIGRGPDIIVSDDRCYLQGIEGHLAAIAKAGPGVERLMLVAHNPDLEGLVAYLTGQREIMPTAALAHIALDLDRWADLSVDCGALEQMLRPRELER